MKEDAPTAGGEPRHPGFFVSHALRAIDASLHGLQRLRNRIEPPVEEEPRRRGGQQTTHPEELPPVVGEPPAVRHSYVHAVLVFLLPLLLGAVAGTLFSYRGLARIVETQESMIDYLREQITQLEKEDARNSAAKIRYQKEVYEREKELRASREEIQDYKDRIGELEAQVAALKPPPAVARGGRPAPAMQKSATCAMDAANPAANLAGCLERFNRK